MRRMFCMSLNGVLGPRKIDFFIGTTCNYRTVFMLDRLVNTSLNVEMAGLRWNVAAQPEASRLVT